jgi:hypothetical protein
MMLADNRSGINILGRHSEVKGVIVPMIRRQTGMCHAIRTWISPGGTDQIFPAPEFHRHLTMNQYDLPGDQ